MRRLAKNLILAAAVVSAIFIVDLSTSEAANFQCEKICPLDADSSKKYLDFWSKFRDTVMPDEPQDNNPPKEMKKPPPAQKPAPAPRPAPAKKPAPAQKPAPAK